ncbi:OLC1v1010893C1 [Oldenlandia corymbosa var. corymbosa]|uniref:OLC1v1010893C1 n=1 Tax=Oldenlandia corymbosa var. corymbosa TaxID=529605 RepID=A0AAV1DUU2_OLDCO|nr:OLC1v1010893C1 [Oldenlandia corymbosa var. corymbosa]
MAALVVKALGSAIRVFKWDMEPPLEEESSASALEYLGGIILVRLRTTFASDPERKIDQDHEIFFPKSSLNNLKHFETARKLIGAALKQLPYLDSCRNLAAVAGSLTADLLFKFNFGTEILSGDGAVPVIYLRMEIKLGDEKPNSRKNVNAGEIKFPGNVYGLIYVDGDFRSKKIRRLCRELCYGGRKSSEVTEPPLGFEEVKPAIQIKYFEDSIAGDDPQGNQCPICFDSFSEGTMFVETSCSYRFHKKCMYEWLLDNSSCPICGSICIVTV